MPTFQINNNIMETLKKNIGSIIAQNVKILELNGELAANQFEKELKRGVIVNFFMNLEKLNILSMTLPYKVRKIDENKHDIENNIMPGEVEKLTLILRKNSLYSFFTIKEIKKRQSSGDGINFHYEFTFDFEKSKSKEFYNFLISEIKKQNVNKEDIIKYYRKEKYSPVNLIRVQYLIRLAITIFN
jgi:hypothetical protein